jgi:hypothetical protein
MIVFDLSSAQVRGWLTVLLRNERGQDCAPHMLAGSREVESQFALVRLLVIQLAKNPWAVVQIDSDAQRNSYRIDRLVNRCASRLL